jgi:hypothetical protein
VSFLAGFIVGFIAALAVAIAMGILEWDFEVNWEKPEYIDRLFAKALSMTQKKGEAKDGRK